MAESLEARLTIDKVDKIVDADAHMQVQNEDLFLSYLDEESELKKFREQSHRHYLADWPSFNGTTTPSFTWNDHDPEEKYGFHLEFDAIETEEVLREHEVDHGVLSGTWGLFANLWRKKQLVRELVEGYNDWFTGHLDEVERLNGLCLITGHEPSRMAEVIDDMADEDSMVGISWGSHGLDYPPGHERYDPIYQAAEGNDMPICMHSISGDGGTTFPHQYDAAETSSDVHAFNHPFAHMWNLGSLIFGGVPERFPDLQFVFQEGGLGYAPYMKHRLDHAYHELGYEVPNLNTSPSTYFDQNFHFTTQPLGHTAENPQHIAWLIDMVGAENVMFSADLPHPDFDTPEELFNRINPYLDHDEVQAVMGGNAVELFEL